MSHFYGVVEGQARTPATRRGSKNGLRAVAASWNGAIEVELFVGDDGRDRFRVYERKWHGAGVSRLLAEGVIGEPEE